MKLLKLSFLLLLIAFTACTKKSLESDGWKIVYDSNTNGVNIGRNSTLLFRNLYATYLLDGKTISSKDYSKRQFNTANIKDAFGAGIVFTVTYTENGLPDLKQSFYVYPNKEYVLTEFLLESTSGEVASNYMAPINIDQVEPLFEKENARVLFIPFDNDCWIRYQSHSLDKEKLTSYEVTAIFDNDERKGIVVGSVEHDKWKTAIDITNTKNGLGSLVCYGGVADTLTRDSKPHGALSGKIIKSPKVLLGIFNDWRTGLNEYGEANAVIAPPKAWDKAMPFGWNSWGVLQFNLTFPKAMEVSDFFKNNLQEKSFLNSDGTIYIGLDSGWNRFTEDELKAFVQKCKENGQIAGIYWTPFTDWGKNPESNIRDAKEYQYKDVYLYANGEPQELDGAYAIDPTHPAIEAQMKKTSDLFRRCGFEYVKMDFMTHGAMEADRWFLPEIQTGIQAYNYGMELLNQYFGDMYINLSISPIFPAQYAQSRRIACDAWNKIKDTEYTMNAVSYGWWIDKVYQYNDADHVVLHDATEGENRARITSAVITGLYIAGDDFSNEGSVEGKERAVKYLTNPLINAIAIGDSFLPVEGNGEKSENQFMRTDDNGTYYVFFNYGEETVNVSIPLERIGLDASKEYQATNLWDNQTVNVKDNLLVPGKDVLVVHLVK